MKASERKRLEDMARDRYYSAIIYPNYPFYSEAMDFSISMEIERILKQDWKELNET